MWRTVIADCRAWGKFPLPSGWNQKVSTSYLRCRFQRNKDQDNAQRQPETEGSAQEENWDRESRCVRQPRDLGLRGIQKGTRC
ncbi:MAG: hypothetical protein WA130_16665 [Candidatus Methanoperedens sp.]